MHDSLTTADTRHKSLEFGGFTLDVGRGMLLRDGSEIRLRPQSYQVLRYLAENANRLVTKDEIFAAVWGRTVVTDDSLAQCLVDIRRALGDEGHEVVRTVPRRGYVFEVPVVETGGSGPPEGADDVPPDSRRPRRWIAVAGICAALALSLWWVLEQGEGGNQGRAGRTPANTIAVLAFSDLSEGGDQQHFADGVAEEILNLLARVPELRVVARTSSFAFRDSDADVMAIGKALDVAYVLEGSVRRSQDRVRVTAQLVETASGAHVWSENYDRELGDMIAVQAGIAERVAQSLEVTLTKDVLAATGRPINPAAYEHYLQGRYLHNRRLPGDEQLAQQSFRRALAVDPEYGAAWAGLAGALMVDVWHGDTLFASVQPAIEEAIHKALALDPSSAEVQSRATQYFAHSGDRERANLHRQRARVLGRNSPLVLSSDAGNLAARGDFSEAAALSRRAVALDPLNAVARMNLARILATNGEYEEASTQFQRARELWPRDSQLTDGEEVEYLVLLGRREEALELASQLPDGPVRDYAFALAWQGPGQAEERRAAIDRLALGSGRERGLRLAEIYAQSGDADSAFAWIETARREIDESAPTPGSRGRALHVIIPSPMLRPLHRDPRWAELIRQAKEK